MRPHPLLPLLLAGLALVFLILFIQLGIIRLVLDKLGLSAEGAFSLLLLFLLGSLVNLPLWRIRAEAQAADAVHRWRGLLPPSRAAFRGETLIAINLGGALGPLLLSIWLFLHNDLGLWQVLLGIGVVAAISYRFSRPVPGLGIAMPILIAPLSAALVGILLSPQHSAPLAYISGTLGVLLGADILRLRDIRRLGVPLAAIGGAGTFDGIFITGIVAVLLA